MVKFAPLTTSSPTKMTEILEEIEEGTHDVNRRVEQGQNIVTLVSPPPAYPKLPEGIITSNMSLNDENALPSEIERECKEAFNKVSPKLNLLM